MRLAKFLTLTIFLTAAMAVPALADSVTYVCRNNDDLVFCVETKVTQTTKFVSTQTMRSDVTQTTEFVPTETTEFRDTSTTAPCRVGNAGRTGSQEGTLTEEFLLTSTQETLVTSTQSVTITSTQEVLVTTTTIRPYNPFGGSLPPSFKTTVSETQQNVGSPVITEENTGDPVVTRDAVGNPVVTEEKVGETFVATGKCKNVPGK